VPHVLDAEHRPYHLRAPPPNLVDALEQPVRLSEVITAHREEARG
jgi:hypothetical protein